MYNVMKKHAKNMVAKAMRREAQKEMIRVDRDAVRMLGPMYCWLLYYCFFNKS